MERYRRWSRRLAHGSPPLSLLARLAACVAWAFIVARALIAPVCAMYLATLGKRAMVRREMYGNLLLTIGDTIQQILENLQVAADERLIEPLWRMQVLVDRASRATTDNEMDAFDDDLLKALGELRHLRDQLHEIVHERVSAGSPPGLDPTSAMDAMDALDALDAMDNGRSGEESAAVASPLSGLAPLSVARAAAANGRSGLS
jgi:hypothetical protein